MKTLNFIRNNFLFKVTSVNTLLVVVRMVFSIVTQKILAILIGAEGIAQVGNLKNVYSFFEQFSILGTSNGLVKYISEFKDNRDKLNDLFSTGMVFASIASLFSFLILFFWSTSVSNIIFGENNQFGYIFKILAFVVPFMGVNSILNALLNGVSAYKIYSKVTLATIIISFILIVFLTMKSNVEGTLLAIVLTPVIQLIMVILFFSKFYAQLIDVNKFSFNLSFKNGLLSYSIMSIVVILSINATDVAVRDLIEKKTSVQDAGYWTALTSISKTYMQFTAAIFPLYILPKYSTITSTHHFRKEVLTIYKLLLPFVVTGLVFIYLFRNLVIHLLYTNEFLEMANLFKWQLMGDFLKFIALVMAYQFLAKRQIWYFVFTELLSVILFYIFSVYFIKLYGTEGVVMAHFFRYIVYLLVVLYILRFNFIGKDRSL
ncbi:O-antigen translocase [Mariniflexile maritimum]|uniref:O-antigen translocase n=1 Tax=Mariniflexile maritimum TaxID=2682493 RepID=UPI0012F62DAE|nr:O-antigen translocase [Mariniflexile maritimum]